MINNRQNGRRRGRGGGAPRPNGSGGAPDRGNRLDNRARGNAAQLHEKYKTLARDARRLTSGGYRLSSLEVFDLFPVTPHVETLGVFDR